MTPTVYGPIDYRLDLTRMQEVGGILGSGWTPHYGDIARDVVGKIHPRLRTGPRHVISGSDASFHDVGSAEVTDDQAFAVMMDGYRAAEERVNAFRAKHEGVDGSSTIEQLVNAVRIAEIDAELLGHEMRPEIPLAFLGGRISRMNNTEKDRAKRRIGYEMFYRATAAYEEAAGIQRLL